MKQNNQIKTEHTHAIKEVMEIVHHVGAGLWHLSSLCE